MPSWGLHLSLADAVLEKIGSVSRSTFMVGALIPDAPWLPIQEAIRLGVRIRLHRHEDEITTPFSVANVSKWVCENARKVQHSDLWKGALTHIILDHEINVAWNAMFSRTGYESYVMYDGDAVIAYTHEQIALDKWDDEAIYTAEFHGDKVLQLLEELRPGFDDSALKSNMECWFRVDQSGIPGMLGTIRKITVKSMETNSREHRYIVPTDIYDSIFDTACTKSVHMLKMVDRRLM